MKKRAQAPKKAKTEIQELSEFIRDRMVTKEYLDGQLGQMVTKGLLDEMFDKKLAPIYTLLENHTRSLSEIREEVRDIRRTLEDLERRIGNVKRYADDIDFLYKRLAVIEEHIGIKGAKA